MQSKYYLPISIVIPTYNRFPYIIDTIKSLNYDIELLKGEIIIIDQSDLEISVQIKNSLKGFKNVKYFYCNVKSLPYARNLGFSYAEGDIILFLDDDIIPDQNLLLEHINGYEYSKEIGCIAGRVREKDNSLKNGKLTGVNVAFYGKVIRNLDSDCMAFVHAPLGANMSFKREVLENVGKFDVHFTGTSTLEETDFGFRIRKQGYKILFNPKASLFHLLAPAGGCRVINIVDREFSNSKNTVRFFLKNMNKIYFPFLLLWIYLSMYKRLRKSVSLIKIQKIWFNSIKAGINSYRSEI